MKSQTILGIIFIIIGLPIMLIPVVGWIYGPLLILLGIALIIYRNAESKIEQVKEPEINKKSRKTKGGMKKK